MLGGATVYLLRKNVFLKSHVPFRQTSFQRMRERRSYPDAVSLSSERNFFAFLSLQIIVHCESARQSQMHPRQNSRNKTATSENKKKILIRSQKKKAEATSPGNFHRAGEEGIPFSPPEPVKEANGISLSVFIFMSKSIPIG